MTDEKIEVVRLATAGRALLKFLRGEAALDGAHFGEAIEGQRGRFWWRKHLGVLDLALDRLSTPAPDIAALIEALRKAQAALAECGSTFAFYADSHRLKRTTDGSKKAQRNEDMVNKCLDTLGPVKAALAPFHQPNQEGGE